MALLDKQSKLFQFLVKFCPCLGLRVYQKWRHLWLVKQFRLCTCQNWSQCYISKIQFESRTDNHILQLIQGRRIHLGWLRIGNWNMSKSVFSQLLCCYCFVFWYFLLINGDRWKINFVTVCPNQIFIASTAPVIY